MYVVESLKRPGFVQFTDPPRQFLLAEAIVRRASRYRVWTTDTPCLRNDPLPSDRKRFYGEPVPVMDAAGGVQIETMTFVAPPVTLSGYATTTAQGKAVLDWSALKLKGPPSDVDVKVIGRPLPWCFDADPTATGATVSLREDKSAAVLSVTVAVAGGQPAAGVRLWWRVTA